MYLPNKPDDVRDCALKNSGELPPVNFQTFGKIARFRDLIVSEKLDGTNAAVGILPFTFGTFADNMPLEDGTVEYGTTLGTLITGPSSYEDGMPTVEYFVYAQSRNRLITPGKQDNAGFAGWVQRHALELVNVLGGGLHFGEWWGEGIQRKYGMDRKVFSLFNTHRWGWLAELQAREDWYQTRVSCETHNLSGPRAALPDQLNVVPELYSGPWDMEAIDNSLDKLEREGSLAAPGFMNPEGVVAFLPNARVMFKKTLGGDGGKFSQ